MVRDANSPQRRRCKRCHDSPCQSVGWQLLVCMRLVLEWLQAQFASDHFRVNYKISSEHWACHWKNHDSCCVQVPDNPNYFLDYFHQQENGKWLSRDEPKTKPVECLHVQNLRTLHSKSLQTAFHHTTTLEDVAWLARVGISDSHHHHSLVRTMEWQVDPQIV